MFGVLILTKTTGKSVNWNSAPRNKLMYFSPKQLLELYVGLYGVPYKDRITNTILKMVSQR